MAPNYPEPLTIPPLHSHRHTFILLHGRGSNAPTFGPTLLASPISPSDENAGSLESTTTTLTSAFPHAKFIFPTASKRRATVYKRSIINQWFDNWTLDADTPTPTTAVAKQDRESLQVDGLRESSAYIHDLLKREIALVGGNARNVVLGGLSQGCAATLVALLLWDGDPLGAAVGMCGWLPFREQMEDAAREMGSDNDVEGEDFNPFAEEDVGNLSSNTTSSPVQAAITHLQEELEITSSPTNLPFQDTPLFLGHGVEDAKVPIGLGREAASCLSGAMTMKNVSWNEYRGLGHWYSPSMLKDLVDFVHERIPKVES